LSLNTGNRIEEEAGRLRNQRISLKVLKCKGENLSYWINLIQKKLYQKLRLKAKSRMKELLKDNTE
jgi:hypothetical protein